MKKKLTKAIKYDSGKSMIDLVIPEFIEDIAKVLTFGAQKYEPYNWQNNLKRERMLSALYRHLLAYHKGEKYDKETGLNHLAHVAVNAMFLHWYDEVKKK